MQGLSVNNRRKNFHGPSAISPNPSQYEMPANMRKFHIHLVLVGYLFSSA
jgi:hypothetical protein